MSAPAVVAELRRLLAAPGRLDLSWFPYNLRDMALEALAERDALGFLIRASSDYGIRIVFYNQGILDTLGILEEAFVHAVTGCRVNNYHDYQLIAWILSRLDRAKLRAAGDSIPGTGPWTLYRGVSGRGAARRVRGFSWTADRDRAEWFARRGAQFGLADPAVATATVEDDRVLFYTNDREEQEFFVDLPSGHPVKVQKLTPMALEAIS